MKLSVIISINNRSIFLEKSLWFIKNKTMNKKDFEIIIINDNSRENILECIKNNLYDLNINYIKINSKKYNNDYFWGPSISNNIGFKKAKGDVIVITGPEIIHKETNLEKCYNSCIDQKKTIFGHVYHSSKDYINKLNNLKIKYEQAEKINGLKYFDITKNTFYWFICAVEKQAVLNINGCDENFMFGICGDDDDFANRLDHYGYKKTHNFEIEGIHIDHSIYDSSDPNRKRGSKIWESARLKNTKYLNEWFSIRNKEVIVNCNHCWGDFNLIEMEENMNNKKEYAKVCFESKHYQNHNDKRQQHLLSLELDLENKSVLEVGAGIGDHSKLFLDKNCEVTITEERDELLDLICEKYKNNEKAKIVKLNMENPTVSFEKKFDIVYCYGLLYHLKNPEVAIKYMAENCQNMMLLETCVSFEENDSINLCQENINDPTQSSSGYGCRPSRGWIFKELKKYFKYVYLTKTQPNHEEFPLNWDKKEHKAQLTRSVFVASNNKIKKKN